MDALASETVYLFFSFNTTKVYQLKEKVRKIPQIPTPPNFKPLNPLAKILNLVKIPNFTNLSATSCQNILTIFPLSQPQTFTSYPRPQEQRSTSRTAIAIIWIFPLPKPPMTAKEQLLQEIETASDETIDQLLDFLNQTQATKTEQPFLQFIEELTADIPPEVLETLPTDGAEQHDHYLYGTLKH